jgi:hypothetical protein
MTLNVVKALPNFIQKKSWISSVLCFLFCAVKMVFQCLIRNLSKFIIRSCHDFSSGGTSIVSIE